VTATLPFLLPPAAHVKAAINHLFVPIYEGHSKKTLIAHGNKPMPAALCKKEPANTEAPTANTPENRICFHQNPDRPTPSFAVSLEERAADL
jgi:hypothetical protein